MRHSFRICLICFSIIIFPLSNLLAKPNPKNETNVEVDKIIQSMSLKQKLGQLLVIGFGGTKIDGGIRRRIQRLNPGSVIIFKRNIRSLKQIATLNRGLNEISLKQVQLPLFVMVDQEGGSVTRIRTRPIAPSALAMGFYNNLQTSHEYGFINGALLRGLGFNINLAPVVDLSDPYGFSFIGNRSFGMLPEKVSNHAIAYGKGLVASGVLPTFKHFPGHGQLADSHKQTPSSLTAVKELLGNDLLPYSSLVASKTSSAVMVAHIAFPNIDATGVPATFSKKIVEGLLINKLKYRGLVLTDDLEMIGAKMVGSLKERAVMAVEAGCDMIMIAWSYQKQKQALDGLIDAVRSGRISEERIDRSVRKIINAKLGLKSNPTKSLSSEALKMSIADLKKFTRKVHKKNMDLLKLRPELKAKLSKKNRLLVISADSAFYRSIKLASKNKVHYLRLSRNRRLQLKNWFKKFPDAIAIYYVTGLGSAKRLNQLPQDVKSKIFVVNTINPGAIETRGTFASVIDIYSRNYEFGRALVKNMQEPLPPIERTMSSTLSEE